MDWYGNRHNEKFIYKRVSWNNWTEHEAYGNIISGTLEFSESSDLKVTGSFSFEGMDIPDTNDLMRIYYSFQDDEGNRNISPLATLFTSYAGLSLADTRSGVKGSGSLTGSSVLVVLQNKIYGMPYTVTRNTNVIYKASQLIKSCGLNVDYTADHTVLSADHTFDASATYLDIVKWLCRQADFRAPYPDPEGTVLLRPRDREETLITFRNDDQSIMYPEIQQENEWQSTPNVVKMLYSTDLACIAATARNISGSRASLEERGEREQTYFEEVGELSDGIPKITGLIEKAEAKLRELSCDVEFVVLSHAYIPIHLYEPVRIVYSDMEWTGNVENISISLAPATKTQTKIKKVLYDVIIVEVSGNVLRGAE